MKYLAGAGAILLLIILFPQILGGVIGMTFALAFIPGAKALIVVLIIWAVIAEVMKKDKRRKSENHGMMNNKQKE
ncbi:hypothetical protein [Paenibacillus ginsengarvi]|nr:hypothetical protein [Paenibacillus ginsengarvi]